jgi:hypothetical protein
MSRSASPWLLGAALALTLGTAVLPVQALGRDGPPYGTYDRRPPPPPPRYERRPPPRSGMIWTAGHYTWDGRHRRYVWVGGRWDPVRRGWHGR